MNVVVLCTPSGIQLFVGSTGASDSFYGWGTTQADGVFSPATVDSGPPGTINAIGINTVVLDVVARSTPAGQAIRYTRFDFSGIRGNACNYHGLIIQGDPAS